MRYVIIGMILLVLMTAGYFAYRYYTTKNLSPPDTLVYQDGGFLLTVDYCRPFKRGRLIFGESHESPLLPYGIYWRTGANDATEIDFNRDIRIEGNQLKAGRYRLYTIPGKSEWVVALNSELGESGYNEPDYSQDVLRFNVPTLTSDTVCEQFLIKAVSGHPDQLKMNLCWDRMIVPIQIQY